MCCGDPSSSGWCARRSMSTGRWPSSARTRFVTLAAAPTREGCPWHHLPPRQAFAELLGGGAVAQGAERAHMRGTIRG